MRKTFANIAARIAACATALLFGALLLTPAPAPAATANYAIAIPGVLVIPVQLSGQVTTTTAAVVRFQIPFAANVIGVSASARASGGTTPTLTVDVQDDGTTILSAPVSVTAGAVAEAAIATASVADESEITIDLAITGSSPTWDDITVLITVVRQ